MRGLGLRVRCGLFSDLGHWLRGSLFRGLGLFLGVELVRDRGTMAPATAQADHVVNRMRDRGILCKPTHDNIVRLSPPLVIAEEDLAKCVSALRDVLASFDN